MTPASETDAIEALTEDQLTEASVIATSAASFTVGVIAAVAPRAVNDTLVGDTVREVGT